MTSCSHSENPYAYGIKTGTANLRLHLEKTHKQQYIQLHTDMGWIYKPILKKDAEPTVADNRKQALPPFSPETFLEYLVRFVTADDQVRIHC